jgi:hypothetical protein
VLVVDGTPPNDDLEANILCEKTSTKDSTERRMKRMETYSCKKIQTFFIFFKQRCQYRFVSGKDSVMCYPRYVPKDGVPDPNNYSYIRKIPEEAIHGQRVL